LVSAKPRRVDELDREAVHALERDGLVAVTRGLAALPD
jgi:hypothetical protein